MSTEIGAAEDVAEREDQGTVVQLRDAIGDLWVENGKPVTMTAVGSYSNIYAQAEAEVNRKYAKKLRAEGDDFDYRIYNNDLVSRCVTAWTEFTLNGQPAPITGKNVLQVLQVRPWIYPQLRRAMDDHARFFVPPSGA
jgi:hypothetical protein